MADNAITRKEFDALPEWEKSKVARTAKIIEGPPEALRYAGEGEIARTEFDAMSHPNRTKSMASGVRVVNALPRANEATGPGEGFVRAKGGIGWVRQ